MSYGARVMSNKIRLGLVGANVRAVWASQSHFPALLASPDVELTAVCTRRLESAEEAREALGAKLAFSDWRTMVTSPEIDAVAVVVRVPEHYGPTRAALEAGKHVYTEWPLGRTTAEAEELAAIARSAGLQTAVGLQSRVSPTLMYMQEQLESGRGGGPSVACVTWVLLASGCSGVGSSRAHEEQPRDRNKEQQPQLGWSSAEWCGERGPHAQPDNHRRRENADDHRGAAAVRQRDGDEPRHDNRNSNGFSPAADLWTEGNVLQRFVLRQRGETLREKDGCQHTRGAARTPGQPCGYAKLEDRQTDDERADREQQVDCHFRAARKDQFKGDGEWEREQQHECSERASG
jgi:hypothetical protein